MARTVYGGYSELDGGILPVDASVEGKNFDRAASAVPATNGETGWLRNLLGCNGGLCVDSLQPTHRTTVRLEYTLWLFEEGLRDFASRVVSRVALLQVCTGMLDPFSGLFRAFVPEPDLPLRV